MHTQILAHLDEPYWHHVALLLAQVQGLADGYNDHAVPSQRECEGRANDVGLRAAPTAAPLLAAAGVPESSFLLVQLGGDLDDLMWLASDADLTAVDAAHSRFGRLRRHAEHRARRAAAAAAGAPVPPLTEAGHCSAVVRLVPGAGDAAELFTSQVTWSSFESMTRIYKTYDLPFTTDGRRGSPVVANRFASFSGYPASLVSGDDWCVGRLGKVIEESQRLLTTPAAPRLCRYVLGPSGLVTLETTIGNNNVTLYELYMLPQTVLEWARSALANRLAGSGAEWAKAFSHLNSGTYNNGAVRAHLGCLPTPQGVSLYARCRVAHYRLRPL